MDRRGLVVGDGQQIIVMLGGARQRHGHAGRLADADLDILADGAIVERAFAEQDAAPARVAEQGHAPARERQAEAFGGAVAGDEEAPGRGRFGELGRGEAAAIDEPHLDPRLVKQSDLLLPVARRP